MSRRAGTALLRRLHRWTGLLLGFWVLIVSLSGGALLFKERYYQALHPGLADPVVSGEEDGYGDLLRRLMEGEEARHLKLVGFPRAGLNAFWLWFADGSEGLAEPSTGKILSRWYWTDDLAAFLFELHAHLLAGEVGMTLSGLAAVLLLLLAATSPWVWWPRRGGSSLRHLVPRALCRRSLIRWHESVGLVTLAPILIVVITGIALVFFPTASRMLSLLFDREPPVPVETLQRTAGQPEVDWEAALEKARAALPGAEIIRVTLPSAVNRAVTFRLKVPGEWHTNGRSYVVVDPDSGEVIQVVDARRQGPGSRIGHLVYPLHAGRFEGTIYWVVGLAAAVGCAGLAVSGFVGYLRRGRAASGRARVECSPDQ